MARAHILAIDQGTTNTKALLIDETGAIVSRASCPVDITFPQPGWVEQDGLRLWHTVTDAVETCLSQTTGLTLAAVAIANQRESVIVWERATGHPAGPCIVWQCRRTAPFCAELRARGLQPLIEGKTGLPIDPLFSASKARWLLDHIPEGHRRAASGDLCVGTIDSWLLWNLTAGGVHACDVSNAARTQLLDLRSVSWDEVLLDAFGIPAAALPAIKPSSGVSGVTVRRGAIPAGVPVASLIGDSHAALFGHAAFRPGAVKATYGTGSSLMTLVSAPVAARGLASTVAWALPTRTWYALEGNITVTGGAVEWLGQLLERPDPAHAVAALASSVADSGGVYLVPAFAGLGAPYWDDQARGLLCGLTRGTTAAHVARATVDSIAYQVHDVFETMRGESSEPLPELLADGGASGNDRLMQFQADVLGRAVVRNRSGDLSACGAAWLAGLATGVWTSLEEIEQIPRLTDRFEPRMPEVERERLLAGWHEAVSRAESRSASSISRLFTIPS